MILVMLHQRISRLMKLKSTSKELKKVKNENLQHLVRMVKPNCIE